MNKIQKQLNEVNQASETNDMNEEPNIVREGLMNPDFEYNSAVKTDVRKTWMKFGWKPVHEHNYEEYMDNDIEPKIIAWVRENPQVLKSYTDSTQGDNPYILNPKKAQTAFVTPRSLQYTKRKPARIPEESEDE